MMDMLLGLASSYSQFQVAPIRHYVNQTPSVYALDNWHINSRLSLQLGLRYDALPHAWERGDSVSNFDPAIYYDTQRPVWNSNGIARRQAAPVSRPSTELAFYMNGIGSGRPERLPARPGQQRLQHPSASRRLL